MENAMKKILFTNVGFKNYAGSEIATMTLANYFLRTNYEVHIFTIEYGEPLRKIESSCKKNFF